MNKMKPLFLLLIAGTLLVSCDKAAYRKTPGGMPYQLFAGKDTTSVKVGNFLKLEFTQKINDSTYFSTVGSLPLYIEVNGQSNPYDVTELWTLLHDGDSVVATQMMDTFIKRAPPGQMNPKFKKGDRVMTYVKVLAVYANDSIKTVAENKDRDALTAREAKVVEDFVKSKKATVQRTPSGAFVEILEPGTGNLIDSGKYVSVNYTGTTFTGEKFDSNIDPAFGHVQPMSFTVGSPGMSKGFDESMLSLRNGASARLYVPSMLAYGGNPPRGSKIKPFENLMFEVKVIDVKDQAPPPPANPAPDQPQIKLQ